MRWRRAARRAAVAAGLVVALPLAYVGVSFALLAVPANDDWDPSAGTIGAYVASNGVHADLVLPVRAAGRDWRAFFGPEHFAVGLDRARYVAIGWGDRDFYLQTPTWADLTVPTALRALSGRNPSLVHVTYLRSVDGMTRGAAMPLTEAAYRALVAYVERSLVLADGRPVAVPGSYSRADAFFEAHGSYSPVNTCNAWVGEALEAAGVRVSRWTPFDVQTLWHLPGYGDSER